MKNANTTGWLRAAIDAKKPKPIGQQAPEPPEDEQEPKPGKIDQGGGDTTNRAHQSSAGWLSRAITQAITNR